MYYYYRCFYVKLRREEKIVEDWLEKGMVWSLNKCKL
jgi:hypothetical protein